MTGGSAVLTENKVRNAAQGINHALEHIRHHAKQPRNEAEDNGDGPLKDAVDGREDGREELVDGAEEGFDGRGQRHVCGFVFVSVIETNRCRVDLVYNKSRIRKFVA